MDYHESNRQSVDAIYVDIEIIGTYILAERFFL